MAGNGLGEGGGRALTTHRLGRALAETFRLNSTLTSLASLAQSGPTDLITLEYYSL
jgi:hypothetical protein